jgi:membrane protease YdiL (CAAX protease family)
MLTVEVWGFFSMKILGEKLGFVGKETKEKFFIVIVSTFLLLFLFHKDVWRPIQYWLFLNGCILFIVPLLSLMFIGKKRKPPLLILTGVFTFGILLFFVLVDENASLFMVVKKYNFIILASLGTIIVTVFLLILGRVDIRKYGFSFGKMKFWVPITVIFFIFMIPLIFWSSGLESFQKTYPMLPLAKKGFIGFIVAELSFGLFFVYWEYFFRGYMLFALEKKMGFLTANLLQAMAFAFMHLGKPELEVYSSLVGGLIIGWLAWKSKSFLPAFIIHWAIQITMDLFAVIR